MSSPVSDRTRSLLSRSLPLVQQRRDLLVERMERSLAAETENKAGGQAGMTATMLVDLLVAQVRSLVESAAFAPLVDVADAHRRLDITGRHYSRFGDALVPILRDLLGATVPREVAAAWCDTFWAVLRVAQPVPETSPA